MTYHFKIILLVNKFWENMLVEYLTLLKIFYLYFNHEKEKIKENQGKLLSNICCNWPLHFTETI